jgi:hypothetical protein
MKIIKTALHYWFALVSVLSFLMGWGMLAHSLKPIQPPQSNTVSTTPLLDLPSIQAYDGSQYGGGLNFTAPGNQSNSNNQTIFGTPRLRSGGS